MSFSIVTVGIGVLTGIGLGSAIVRNRIECEEKLKEKYRFVYAGPFNPRDTNSKELITCVPDRYDSKTPFMASLYIRGIDEDTNTHCACNYLKKVILEMNQRNPYEKPSVFNAVPK